MISSILIGLLSRSAGPMEIRQDLSLKLHQTLVLTPQLQLAIRLLQLSRLELADEINAQLESNPVLDEEADNSDRVTFEDSAREDIARPETIEPDIPHEENGETHEPGASRTEAQDWEKFVDSYHGFTTGSEIRVSNEEYPSIEATATRRTTLFDHLMWQLQLSDLTGLDREVGAFIIGNLDEDGRLVDVTAEECAAQTGAPVEAFERVLARIQQFDPVGVAARDLKECLRLQALRHHPENERLLKLIDRHLPDLERRNLQAIARGLQCQIDEVRALVATVAAMEPRPGRAFSGEETVYVQPDVYVYKVGNEYVTVLNEDGLPKLRISPYYEQALAGNIDGQTKDFVQEKLRSAMWLIRSIHQRQSTIRKVTESIVRFQREFLDKGIAYLRPLVLRDVAEDVAMHESTISRVTTNKYVHTPRGIFELKYFFNSRVGSLYGEDRSSESVKARIKALVAREDPEHPLSDQEIVALLRRENVVIARRTVAKYREALGILPSSRRKTMG